MIITDEPIALYHANSAIGWHKLAEFDWRVGGSPARYRAKHITKQIPDRSTEAYRDGRLVHTLTLEGRAKLDTIIAIPPAEGFKTEKGTMSTSANTKAYQEWKSKQEAAGRLIANQALLDEVSSIADAIKAEPLVQRFMETGAAEQTIRLTCPDTGIAVQCRPDWLSAEPGPDGCIPFFDLKTVEDIFFLREDVAKYHYVRQLAWYRRLIALALGRPTAQIKPYIVAAEKGAPWAVQVADIEPDELDEAERLNRSALDELATAMREGYWPTLTGSVLRLDGTLSRERRYKPGSSGAL